MTTLLSGTFSNDCARNKPRDFLGGFNKVCEGIRGALAIFLTTRSAHNETCGNVTAPKSSRRCSRKNRLAAAPNRER
jgi:hypothetical protein